MDVRGRKRVVVTCPHCHKDYGFNGDAIYRNKAYWSEQVSILKAKITAYKAEWDGNKDSLNKDSYYKNLKRRMNEATANLIKAKTELANASMISEQNLMILFKKKLCMKYGQEEIMKLLKESEEEMVYNDYDLAKQRYNRFSGV